MTDRKLAELLNSTKARDALVTAALDYEGAIGTPRHSAALDRFFAAVDAYRRITDTPEGPDHDFPAPY